MKRFENDKKEVVWHIDHKYAAEMKMKSTIVSYSCIQQVYVPIL